MYNLKLSYYMHWIWVKAAHKLSREPLVLDLSVSEDVLQTLLEDYIVCSLRAERHIFEDVYSFACLWNLQMWRVLQSCVKLNSSLARRASSLKLFSFAFITNTSSQRGTADMILKSPFFLFFWNFLWCKFHQGISWAQRGTRALITPKCKSKHHAGETERERIKVVISGQVKTHGYTVHREILGLCKMSK